MRAVGEELTGEPCISAVASAALGCCVFRAAQIVTASVGVKSRRIGVKPAVRSVQVVAAWRSHP